jgi:transcriptional regulator GlxA family with amidase domain
VSMQDNSTFLERHLTVAELASLWKVSSRTIRRLFLPEPGVVIIDHPRRRARTYKTLRIPESVAKQVYVRLVNGGRRGSL